MAEKKPPRVKRSLYDCFQAKVRGERIVCAHGYPLSKKADGALPLGRLKMGVALELQVCQECAEFESMGEPLAPEERGWFDVEAPAAGGN